MRQSDKVNFFLTPVRENPAREWQQYALYSRHNAFGYDGATYDGGPLQFFSLVVVAGERAKNIKTGGLKKC